MCVKNLKPLSLILLGGLCFSQGVYSDGVMSSLPASSPPSQKEQGSNESLDSEKNGLVPLETLVPEEELQARDNGVSQEALAPFTPALPKVDDVDTEHNIFQNKKKVTEIKVLGIHRVDRQAILDHLPDQPEYTQSELDTFVKHLYKSGLFKNVEATLSGTALVVRVEENPSIAEIRFEGNEKILRSDLKEDSGLEVRDIFSKESVYREVKRIAQLYGTKGYYAAKVKPHIQKLKQNRVNIIFEIQEGHRSYNKQIRFVFDSKEQGFKDRTLRGVITSLEDRWWRFLGDPSECYDASRVEYDCELLRKHYYRYGYLDVKVTAHTQLGKNREHFYITFFVHEGAQYSIHKVDIKSEIKNLSVESLNEYISLEKGEVFNAEMPEKVASRMAYDLETRGLSFVEVRPVVEKNDKSHEINLCFVACKAQPIYANKILMKGNYATNDEVLRRNLRFSEGDPLSTNKINASKEALEGMDFFESVGITAAPSTNPKLQDITVEVKEKGTGDVQFSGGYSTQDGILGQIKLEERNLFGKALRGNLSGMVAQHGMDFRAGVANPFAFGRNLTLGGDIFYNRFRSTTKGNFSGEGSYKQSAAGSNIYTHYPLSSKIGQFWGYSIHADNISHFSPYMSPYILENMRGKYNVLNASVEHKLDYGTANIKNGEYVSGTGVEWSTIVHGVGGQIKCVKNVFLAAHYIPLNEDKTVLLKLGAEGGIINKFGYMRFSDQFTLGLFTFPGFRFSGLGPRDERTGDALFAKHYYTASAKLYWGLDFLGIPKETPLRVVGFAYTGSLWNSIFGSQDNAQYILSQKFQNRASYGVGLIWTLPMMGNIGFLFAKPVQRQHWDQSQTFLFIWGQSF